MIKGSVYPHATNCTYLPLIMPYVLPLTLSLPMNRIGVMSALCHVGPTKSDLSTMSDLYASTRSDLSSLKYILKQITTLFKYYKKKKKHF